MIIITTKRKGIFKFHILFLKKMTNKIFDEVHPKKEEERMKRKQQQQAKDNSILLGIRK